MSKVFGWTPDDIDRIELELFFDYIKASEEVEKEQEQGQGNGKPVQKGTANDLFAMAGMKGVKKRG